MKRLLFAAAALAVASGGVFGVGAARADDSSGDGHMKPMLISSVTSSTNDLLSKIPGFGGGDVRHICIINDPLDFYYCIYIPLP